MTKKQWWAIQYRRLVGIVLIIFWLLLSVDLLWSMVDYRFVRVAFVGVMLWLMGLCLCYVYDLVHERTNV